MSTSLHIDDWFLLEMAFTYVGGERIAYLDLRTGEVRVYQSGERLDERSLREFAEEPDRFVHIDPVPTVDQYRWLVKFAVSVGDAKLRVLLERAMTGPRPFRRFMDVLRPYTEEWDRWRALRSAILQGHVVAWLAERDVVVDRPPPSPLNNTLWTQPLLDEEDRLRRTAREYIDRLSPASVRLAIDYLRHVQGRSTDP